jgi:hypothetical protein
LRSEACGSTPKVMLDFLGIGWSVISVAMLVK